MLTYLFKQERTNVIPKNTVLRGVLISCEIYRINDCLSFICRIVPSSLYRTIRPGNTITNTRKPIWRYSKDTRHSAV